MLVDREPALELDESDLFEHTVDMSPGSGPAAGAPLSAALQADAAAAAAAYSSDDESESDDDGIVLDSECSSSEADDAVESDLICRIQSLQSSLEQTSLETGGAEPLGTSHSSQVGSLKTFDGVSFKGKRLFHSDSDLAASMPAHAHHHITAAGRPSAPMYAGRRQVAPLARHSCSNLGTSMPISIPMLHRRNSAADMMGAADLAARIGASTFVPPHMVHRQESEEAGTLTSDLMGPSLGLGLSPSAHTKREKLMARNAILRSTGFLEVQHTPTAVIGEVMDPVKDQLLRGAMGSTVPLAVPGLSGRSAPRSGLTQMLGTSK